tara:strand:- start:3842 stop:6193 length:2352 start_codon:yes stop_codon:yes gene_type:complete
MKIFRLLLLLALSFLSVSLSATDESIIKGLKFYNAGLENIDFQELKSLEEAQFVEVNATNQNQGFTANNYWLRFSLINSDSTTKTYYLETARPVTDNADLYQKVSGDWLHKQSGDQMQFSERDLAHRNTSFKIELAAGSETEFYLHLKSDGETLAFNLEIQNPDEFWETNYTQQAFLGGFYGMLAISALIYLFFFTSLRENSFLYYGIYVISIALMQSALDGFIYQYVFPSGSYINARMVLISALFSNYFLLKYTQSFLKVEKWAPYFNHIFRLFYMIIPTIGVLLFINESSLALAYPLSNVNGFLSLVLILVTIVYIHFKRKPVDSYFLIGILFLVLGLLGFVMNNLGILPNTFYVVNSAKFGITLEVVFLSLSMTNLIARLRREKEASQKEALRKSEEMNDYKSYFMSNISHELRTPINAILGMATELLEDSRDPDLTENYRIIKSASYSLLSKVSDILDFEHIEKNDLEMDDSFSFSPREVVQQVCDSWDLEARKKGIEFISEVDASVPNKLKGDEKRFGQIINNILSNAVKFTHKGSVQLKLSSTQVTAEVSKIQVQIIDTGIGMKREELNSVFESFNQMKLNNKRRYGGLGLGLTIVKHLIELFKGNIDIQSVESQGTKVEFSLELPVVENTNAVDLQEKMPEATTDGKMHVLVVEDNVMNQMIMKKLLASSEFLSIQIANNGEEALAQMKEKRFDLILMDLQMPVMDGYETTEAIRAGALGEAYRQIPIIAVTADAMQETKQRVFKIGMNDYLTKPVRKDLLLERISIYANELKIAI